MTTSRSFLNQWGVGNDLFAGAIRAGGQAIAIVAHDGIGMDQASANIRLLAAAPSLLDALQVVRMSRGWSDMSLQLRALIDCALETAKEQP